MYSTHDGGGAQLDIWYAIDHDGDMEAPRGQWVRDHVYSTVNLTEAADGYLRVVSNPDGRAGDICIDMARLNCGLDGWYGTADLSSLQSASVNWGGSGECAECGEVAIDGVVVGTLCD